MRNKVAKALNKLARENVKGALAETEAEIGRELTPMEIWKAVKKTKKIFKRVVHKIPRNKRGDV